METKVPAHACQAAGRLFAWSDPLEVVVDLEDGGALITWAKEPLVTAVWNGHHLVDFRPSREGRAPGATGAAVRPALEAAERALRAPALDRTHRAATWSALDDVAALLRGASAAGAGPAVEHAVGLATAALSSRYPAAGVIAALARGRGRAADATSKALLRAILLAVEAQLLEAGSMPWLRPPSSPRPPPLPQKVTLRKTKAPPAPKRPSRRTPENPLGLRWRQTLF